MPVKTKFQWYAVAVETNTEAAVKKSIKREALIQDLDSKIRKMVSPTEKIEEKRNTVKGTKTVTKYEKKLPGYLVVLCELTDEILMLFKETQGVYGFLPLDAKPIAIPGPEVEHILELDKRLNEQAKTDRKVVLNFKVGDKVKVTQGTWKNSEATVKMISGPDNDPHITVEVVIWGRPVEVPNLSHTYVKKVSI